MIAAHQTMLAPQGAPLPYDAEVEYLESTGTQYINTEVNLKNSLSISARIAFTTFSSGDVAFGARGSSSSSNCRVLTFTISGTGDCIVVQRSNFQTTRNIVADTAFHDYFISSSAIKIDNTQFASSNIGNTTAPIFLCRQNVNNETSSPSYSKIRISSFSIVDNGVLVRDYIPVRVGQTGYLFDNVSKQLFGNAGTGAFVIGPDKT